jgi:hypothetical protein
MALAPFVVTSLCFVTRTKQNVGFATLLDARNHVLAQARLHNESNWFAAWIHEVVGDVAREHTEVKATDGDVFAKVRAQLDADDGLEHAEVFGIGAKIYAHRSNTRGDDVLLVGVDAEEGQQIVFVVNDHEAPIVTVGQ